MKLSVNILTWNTWPTLHDTLHVLKDELEGIASEVIIVDNGSTDGCENAATIKNPVNLGISKGKNQGIDASKGEYILLLDGDIVPPRNTLKCMLSYIESHPEIDAIGMYSNKWSNQRNKNGQVHHEEECRELVGIQPAKGHICYFGMYRRTVFERGVRFDESFGVGYGWEDLDTFMQMEKLGMKSVNAHINSPTGKYYHDINSSIRQMGFEKYMETCSARGKMFGQKWGVPAYA